MSVLDYIDTDIFSSVYQNKLPSPKSHNIDAICKELFYAIKGKEEIFIYGDYDMDGFCAAKVWDEVLKSLYNVPVRHFTYKNRMHTVDPDLLTQVKNTRARIVLICDSGSGRADRELLSLLMLDKRKPIVIDHHTWEGNYWEDTKRFLAYNSFEEKESLDGFEVSGAYASLLVASRLCEVYFKHSLSFNAMAYTLASMYADVVDLATPAGRAIYNVVNTTKMPMPALLNKMNSWNYGISRRLFSFIICPRINACFRTETFGPLNDIWTAATKYEIGQIADDIKDIHTISMRNVETLVPTFKCERFGDMLLCVHELTSDSEAMHVRNFSGLIANKIAQEERCMVVAVIHMQNKYVGSYRDFYNRKMLDTFALFCKASGHDMAFGLEFHNIGEVRRYMKSLSSMLESGVRKDYTVISSGLVTSTADVDALALYNEYMNVRPRIFITHRCPYVKLTYGNKFGKRYDVGLPYNVRATLPLLEGSNTLIEPTITRGVDLRCVE